MFLLLVISPHSSPLFMFCFHLVAVYPSPTLSLFLLIPSSLPLPSHCCSSISSPSLPSPGCSSHPLPLFFLIRSSLLLSSCCSSQPLIFFSFLRCSLFHLPVRPSHPTLLFLQLLPGRSLSQPPVLGTMVTTSDQIYIDSATRPIGARPTR